MMQTRQGSTDTSRRLFSSFLLVLALAGAGALVAHATRRPPEHRHITIEAFRYGFSPARIHANRGDRLTLSFSTRDTGQSFFLQDYDLHVVITPGTRVVEVYRLSSPDAQPARMESVELTVGLPGWAGVFASKSQFRNHTYNGPLHGTERGDLIVSPNYLLGAGLGALCAIPLLILLPPFRNRGPVPETRRLDLLARLPFLKTIIRRPSFQASLSFPMLAVFYFVILAGLLGTKVSGRNAGPMVIWVLWLSALILVLVPVGGRIWCLVCPLPTLGEFLQRRSNSLSAGGSSRTSRAFRWPRWLATDWPRTLLFLLLGTFSLALVSVPAATSWLLIGLAGLALATSVFFGEQRLFCRHLCPINSFIGLYSMTGRLMARSVSPEQCRRCEERFCLTGSAKGWGCPYGLCMGEVRRNNDCGLCTECLRTCAYDNVSIFWRGSGWDRQISSNGEAWQAIVMFGLAVVYSLVNLGAWHQVRDWQDIVDRGNWHAFGMWAAALWVLCLVVLPLGLLLLVRLGARIDGQVGPVGPLFRASAAALVPLGLAIWMAFAVAILLSMTTFVLQSLSDPFNWGWDLLGTAGSRWRIIWAPAVPWFQVTAVLVGFAYSLGTLVSAWAGDDRSDPSPARGYLPAASFLWAAAGGMILFFAA